MMKRRILISTGILLLLLFGIIIAFKYGININTYSKTGFKVVTEEYDDESYKKSVELYENKDFENLKNLDYEYTKFFEFPKEGVLCEYIYFNETTIYEGPARERNIYAILCNDKTIKYLRGDIGTIESIEYRYNFHNEYKDPWIYYTDKDEYKLELTDNQYNYIINLLKLLKVCHNKSDEYNIADAPPYVDINVFFMDGKYYDFFDDDGLFSNIIENKLEYYMRKLLYDNSGFVWDDE